MNNAANATNAKATRMVAGERPVLEVERTSISTQVDPPMYATMNAAKMMPQWRLARGGADRGRPLEDECVHGGLHRGGARHEEEE